MLHSKKLRCSLHSIVAIAIASIVGLVNQTFAQVSIKERIAITPGQNPRDNHLLSAADSTEHTVAVINAAPIYQPWGAYGTFFDTTGTFELLAGDSAVARLHGGILAGEYLEGSPQCCIGADDRLTVAINGASVVDFNFALNFAFDDPLDAGINLSPYVHTVRIRSTRRLGIIITGKTMESRHSGLLCQRI